MTTVAYKDGVIAHDGRMTGEETILSDRCKKSIVKNDRLFVFAGDLWDFLPMVDSYDRIAGNQWGEVSWFNGEMLVWCMRTGTLSSFVSDTQRGYVMNVEMSDPYAFGSGGVYALGAMVYGASAVEAVRVASKLDVYTGGRIKKYVLRKKP